MAFALCVGPAKLTCEQHYEFISSSENNDSSMFLGKTFCFCKRLFNRFASKFSTRPVLTISRARTDRTFERVWHQLHVFPNTASLKTYTIHTVFKISLTRSWIVNYKHWFCVAMVISAYIIKILAILLTAVSLIACILFLLLIFAKR